MLDRVDEHPDFDPREHYALTLTNTELSDIERNAVNTASSADDIDLDLP